MIGLVNIYMVVLLIQKYYSKHWQIVVSDLY
jgi:hypothetical protein